jgi:hypothetical protein
LVLSQLRTGSILPVIGYNAPAPNEDRIERRRSRPLE